ncbi:MAG: hypothetical protein KGL39_39165 [Patescibacteria group bacterium]|nr:hypothetical protein [Patescibacteria group bacterium]
MNRIWYRTAASLLAGSFAGGVALDTSVNVDPLYQHPALSPALQSVNITSYAANLVAAGTDLSGSTAGSTWAAEAPLEYTYTDADSFSFTMPSTDAYILVTFAGSVMSGIGATSGDTNLVSGLVRRGALATVQVDGTTVATVDTFGALTYWTGSFADGHAHAVKILHAGSANPSVSPATTPVQTTGTSVSPLITPAVGTTFVSASWRIAATGTSTYSLYTTPVGGTESLVQSGLSTATNYTGKVTGCTLNVPGPLVNGDGATFQTDSEFLGILEVAVATSPDPTGGTYISAVQDSAVLDPTTGALLDLGTSTLWVALRWIQNATPASIAFAVSNHAVTGPNGALALVQDSSYQSKTLTPTSKALPSGVTMGVVGLESLPAARYGQWSVTFAGGAAVAPYVRDLILYWTNPQNDPDFLDTIAAGPQVQRVWDVPSLALLTALDLMLTDYTSAKTDLANSYSVMHAVDAPLAAYGAAVGLPQYTAEPPEAYQARIAAAYAGRAFGGSLAFICSMVATLVQGSPQTADAPIYSPTNYASVRAGGCSVYQTGGRAMVVTVVKPAAPPASPYPGLPGLSVTAAQAILTDFIVNKLRPVGTGVSIVF